MNPGASPKLHTNITYQPAHWKGFFIGFRFNLLTLLKIYIMSVQNNFSSLDELLSRFENGEKLFQTNAVFNKVVRSILQGGDIYKLLEQVIISQENLQQQFIEYAKNDTRNLKITVSQESYNRLLEESPRLENLPE
jgi:Zn-dependent M32 family carboxypeptidase